MIRTSYLVLFIILIAIGVGTASALLTITLAGDVVIEGDLDMTGGKITNVGIPTQSTDAVNKDYADSVSVDLKNAIFYVTNSTVPGTPAPVSITVLCNSGDIATGGGIKNTSNGLGKITENDFPHFVNNLPVGWTLEIYDLAASSDDSFTVYAVCLDKLPLFGSPVTVIIPQGASIPGCESTNECFIPYNATINVGDEVMWSNDDMAAHTVTSGSAADGPSGVFDSSLFLAGTTFSHTFDIAGTYDYFCLVHPWQQGNVIVLEP